MCMFNNCNTRCNGEKREGCQIRREGCCWLNNRCGCNNNRCGCGCGCSNNNWWNNEDNRNIRLRQAFREGYEAGFRDGVRSRMGSCTCRCNITGIMPFGEAETTAEDCGCNPCD